MSKKAFGGVGHGGTDPGAVSGSFKEADMNLVMAQACRAELERHGVQVLMSRYKNEKDALTQEISECNTYNL
ncbi:N-acetylmuramoyl-L-alanine amidase [Paraclostridium bifermentans]|uniref:N-acetylmuramoyl-L-alanine amidase n=1 Tax=Paraclostridium bifermentans TaxID=1490 RepID=UPI0018A8C0D4|nr:N-acetylmuramoyl-L-alanine amidase [Paraclostridium bifermentans]